MQHLPLDGGGWEGVTAITTLTVTKTQKTKSPEAREGIWRPGFCFRLLSLCYAGEEVSVTRVKLAADGAESVGFDPERRQVLRLGGTARLDCRRHRSGTAENGDEGIKGRKELVLARGAHGGLHCRTRDNPGSLP